jgi:hypothetical protein
LLTKPTEDSVLLSFYNRVRPPGFWNQTAAKLKIDRSLSVKAFLRGAYLTVTAGLTVYLLLIGCGKIMFAIGSNSIYIGLIYIVAGLLSITLWWRKLFGNKKSS